MSDITSHQFQHTARQWNPYERQPSNPLGESKRGANLKIPGNEVGHSPRGASTGSQIIENIKIRWGLYMWLRGVNINCELMREALFNSQFIFTPRNRIIRPHLILMFSIIWEPVEVRVGECPTSFPGICRWAPRLLRPSGLLGCRS